MIRLLDRWLYRARGWPQSRVADYVQVLEVDDPESTVPNVVSRTSQLIDTRASGLLTHTSMMIAALGFAGHSR
jgi:hypothetical protein